MELGFGTVLSFCAAVGRNDFVDTSPPSVEWSRTEPNLLPDLAKLRVEYSTSMECSLFDGSNLQLTSYV